MAGKSPAHPASHSVFLCFLFAEALLSLLRDRYGDHYGSRGSNYDRSYRDRGRGRSASPPGGREAAEPPVKKKKEDVDPVLTRTGGAYIPPAKLRMMQQQITDKSRSVG